MPDLTNLLVPMVVNALCVGVQDAGRVAIKFAGPTIDFSLTPYLDADFRPTYHVNRALTGKTLLRPLAEDSSDALEQGVHLHWTLPSALIQGRQTFRLSAASLRGLQRKISADVLERLAPLQNQAFGSEDAFLRALKECLGAETLERWHAVLMSAAEREVTFPPLPNRWLITRQGTRNGVALPERRWVLESDYLMTRAEYEAYYQATGRSCICVPVDPVAGDADLCTPFRFMGRAFDFDGWKEGGVSPIARMDDLTAVGRSGPGFTAYYPDCSSVFGFHDPFKNEPPPEGETVLSYHVVGWYSDPAKDPVSRDGVLALHDGNGWDFEPQAAPDRVILTGRVSQIPWDPRRDYLRAERPLRKVAVAVGHTTTEALSALIAREWHNQTPAANQDQRAGVESLLDALQLGLLAKLGPGFGLPALEEALYQNGFGATPGGHLWVIRKRQSKAQPEAVEEASDNDLLPPGMGADLNRLNALQQEYDDLRAEITSRREQIFFDWHKYIHTLYPDERTPGDAARLNDQTLFLSSQADAVRTAESQAGILFFNAEQGLPSTASPANSLAGRIADQAARIARQLDTEGGTFLLERTGAPRFWQPQEPVLLLKGEDIRPTAGAQEEKLACRVSIAPLEALASEETEGQPWQAPWRPIFLRWRVRFRPVVKSTSSKYTPDFITDNFALDGDAIDYAAKPGRPLGEEYFEGVSLLSTRAAFNLSDQIRRYAKAYPDQDVSKRLAPLAELVDGLPLLSQGLNGLNQAFLMREQSLQARVGDPTGDENNLSDTTVRAAVGDMNVSSPLPFVGFSPLRGGFLEVAEIQLIDAFGQRAVLRDPPLVRAERMTLAPDPAPAYLAPRFCQPARLLLRWLDAEDDRQEMNPFPATTPVCGWLLPNHLDGSLMAYDASGQALGSVGLEGKKQGLVWRRAPGLKSPVAPEAINPHLLAFLRMFVDLGQGRESLKSKSFFADLLAAVEDSYSHVVPSADLQPSLSVLIGRPMALVRASLRLQLHGLPAKVLSWDSFNHDVRSALVKDEYDPSRRDAGGFPDVLFPTRLGDASQPDDGLIGFFVEGDPNRTFYSLSAAPGRTNGVQPPVGSEVSLDGRSTEVRVTMLIDPRGRVSATLGVLPVKSIDIPAELWTNAFRKIEAAFFATPVLSRKDNLVLPLPRQPGFRWSWVAHGLPEETLVENPSDDRARPSYSPLRLREGWLKLTRQQDEG